MAVGEQNQENLEVAPSSGDVSSRDSIIAHIQELRASGLNAEAHDAASEASRIFANDPDVINLYAEICFDLAQHQKAFDLLSGLVERWPTHATALMNLGVLLWATGNVGEALDFFLWALRVDPYNREACVNCGNAMIAMGKLQDARTVLEVAWSAFPGDQEIGSSLIVALERKGLVHAARDVAFQMSQPVDGNEKTEPGDINTVRSYTEEGWRTRISRMHSFHRCEMALAAMCMAVFPVALHWLDQVTPLGLPEFSWHQARALCFAGMKRWAEARRELQTELAKHPDNQTCQVALAKYD